jgi:hypothetical protein
MSLKLNNYLPIINNSYFYKSHSLETHDIINKNKNISLFIQNICNEKTDNISQVYFYHSVKTVFINIKIYSPYNKSNQIKSIKNLMLLFINNNIFWNKNNQFILDKNNFLRINQLNSLEYYFSNIYNKKVKINFYFYTKPFNNTFIFGKYINYLNNIFMNVIPVKHNKIKSLIKFFNRTNKIQIKDKKIIKTFKDLVNYNIINKSLHNDKLNYNKFNLLANSIALPKITPNDFTFNNNNFQNIEKPLYFYNFYINRNLPSIKNKNLIKTLLKLIIKNFDSKNILGIKIIRKGKVSSFRSKTIKSMKGLIRLNIKNNTNKYINTNITQININHSLGLEGIKLLINTKIN